MVKSDSFQKKISRKKARIRLFIQENPLCTFAQILKNGKIGKNKKYLKIYLDELIKAKAVTQVPFQDKYFVSPVPEDRRYEVLLVLLDVLIDDAIGNNSEVHENRLFKSVYGTKNVEWRYFEKTENHPLPERVLAKYYILWILKLGIFHTDFKKVTYPDNKIWKRIKDNGDRLLDFGKELESFLSTYNPRLPSEDLKKLEKEVDMQYELDIIYANKLFYHTRPLHEIIRIAVEDLILGTKEATKAHLELRRTSKYKHGDLPEDKYRKDLDKKLRNLQSKSKIKKQITQFENRYLKLIKIEPRKYPRKMTNTKILIKNITDSQGKPDETKLVSSYLSELGRINITETPYEFIKLYLNLWGMRNFMNNAPNTPKNVMLKSRIQRIFDKLQGET